MFSWFSIQKQLDRSKNILHPMFSFIWTFFLNLESVFNSSIRCMPLHQETYPKEPGCDRNQLACHGLGSRCFLQFKSAFDVQRRSFEKEQQSLPANSEDWRVGVILSYIGMSECLHARRRPLSHKEFQAALVHETFQQIYFTNQFSLLQVLT